MRTAVRPGGIGYGQVHDVEPRRFGPVLCNETDDACHQEPHALGFLAGHNQKVVPSLAAEPHRRGRSNRDRFEIHCLIDLVKHGWVLPQCIRLFYPRFDASRERISTRHQQDTW